ncbi:MAG: hypothetical protein MUP98_12685 [Candidatus Aminicenantes bacterium]|nr:hypothetical protein [Candidatus Aminicenantes bacterium]
MKRILYFGHFLCFFIFSITTAVAQFTPAELSQREDIEKWLTAGEIVRSEEIGEGVTKPYRLFLKAGEVEISGAWKNPKGMQQGFLEGWQYEIAAYQVDKLLGLNMVPPTVERSFNKKAGSFQFWVSGTMSDLDRIENNVEIPASSIYEWENRKYLTRAFDCIIANDDRTQQNLRYTEDWRTILIDHSRAFRSTKEHTKNLIFGKNGLKGAVLFRRLPRIFVENVKALNFDQIKAAVGDYLTTREINAILSRKDIFLKEIEDMIKEQGEAAVLY